MTDKKDTWLIHDEFISIVEQENGTYGISSNSALEDDDKPFASFSVEKFKTREDALDGVLEYLSGAEFCGASYEDGTTISEFI